MLAHLTAQITALVAEMDAVGFNLKFDLGGDGVIYVAAKEAPVVVTNTDSDAETTLRLSADNLQQLLDKKLKPTTAFMFGKIKIDGDMSNVMSLTSIFS